MSGQWIPGFWSASTESKGKGKGIVNKGKGKGKGKGGESDHWRTEEDWPCKEIGCGLNVLNFARRSHCMGCGCKRRTPAELQRARNNAKKVVVAEADADGFTQTRKQRRNASAEKRR